jgi:hypothetical protein
VGLSRNRTRLNLLLAGCGLSLAVVTWLGRQPDERHPTPVTRVDPGSVRELRLRRGPGDELRFTKESGAWLITAPDRLPASPSRVAELLEVLKALPRASYDAAQVDSVRVGLDPPQAVLEVTDLELRFGQRGNPEGYRYLAVGEQIHMISDRYYDTLAAPLADFVARQPLLADPLQRIETASGTLSRLGEPPIWSWTATTGRQQSDGEAMAAAWRTGGARSVHPLDPLAPEGVAIQVWLEGRDEPLRFELLAGGGDNPALLRRDLRLLYLLTPTLAAELTAPGKPLPGE